MLPNAFRASFEAPRKLRRACGGDRDVGFSTPVKFGSCESVNFEGMAPSPGPKRQRMLGIMLKNRLGVLGMIGDEYWEHRQ